MEKKKKRIFKPVVYGIVKYNEDGKLEGLCDAGLSMKFVEGQLYLWKGPPTHYFKPWRGDKIVKVTRQYDDISFDLKRLKTYRKHYRNFHFKQKNNE